MILVITIDVEEDNWGGYECNSFTLENVKKIPSLQRLFDEYDVIPTYLVTYPVATSKESVYILKEILRQGKCEIGMHCHPWSTPPFDEDKSVHNSMLCNLSSELQRKKLSVLHDAIEKNLGVAAKSFRAGRWGYNGTVSSVIKDLGYTVDTSITPFTDWSEYHGPDYSLLSPEPYRFESPEIFERHHNGSMIEIPASIGYLQSNYELCASVDRALKSNFGKYLRLKGVLNKMYLLNKIWLSPETSDAYQMIKLTKVFIRKKYKIINMFFHSTSLQAGLTSYVKSKEDEIRYFNRMREYFKFTSKVGIKSVRLSDAYQSNWQDDMDLNRRQTP